MVNRLAQSQSLYLRKHAENPIDWWPWCDEALETARQQNKPIFLSIGYSSCHWCTVMEGEAFSDEAIATYMNHHFLPIKVDREERPDIDSIYMQALQLMTGQGGWPLNVFLAPDDRVPFYGGTYFPLEPKFGRPGFLQVLQTLRRFYDADAAKVRSVKSEILQHLQQAASQSVGGELTPELLQQGLDYSAGILSSGSMGPSFPMIPYAGAALQGAKLQTAGWRYDAATVSYKRGLDLALGGIFDHVGGGFHRYTVDSTWTVPHFEKMLYDNGQIMEYLADLWSAGRQDPAFERAIAHTVSWLQREMTAPEGYFYAAQDADNFTTPDEAEPEEGAFYVWDYDQLSTLLTAPEMKELAEQFSITVGGNFEGHNVLQRRSPGPLTDTTELILAQLFAKRYGMHPDSVITVPPARDNNEAKTHAWLGRIPPVTDTKMIVAWNSLMISGLARAAVVLQRPVYLDLAARAAQFVLQHQRLEGRLYRLNYQGQPSVLAQAEDYALFIKALLDLDQAALGLQINSADGANGDWLAAAVALQAEMNHWLWSEDLGGYYNTASDASQDLVLRERSYSDNATPAANGVAIANLVRLALRSEDLQHLERAEQTLQAFASVMGRTPQACPTLFTALDWYQNHTLVRTSTQQVQALASQYFPTTMLAIEPNLPEGAMGLVCQGLSCQEPALSLEQLQTQIQQSQTRVS